MQQQFVVGALGGEKGEEDCRSAAIIAGRYKVLYEDCEQCDA